MPYSVSTRDCSRSHWFVLAALAGGVHTAITAYWAVGGHGLLWTMGEDFIAKFASMMWILYPLAAVKAIGAFGPMWLEAHGWRPFPRVTRLVFCAASVVLLVWGGMNTLVSNLVLAHVIHPAEGYDRATMIGHAWLWDPLFVVWGIGLLAGLLHARRGHSSRHSDAERALRTSR